MDEQLAAIRNYINTAIYPLEALWRKEHNLLHVAPMELRARLKCPQTITNATLEQLVAYEIKLRKEVKHLLPPPPKPARRTSDEVFETWKSLHESGLNVETRQHLTFPCKNCGGLMPPGNRVYANPSTQEVMHYYVETCQQIAAPGQPVHHVKIVEPPAQTYKRKNQQGTTYTIPVKNPTPPPKEGWIDLPSGAWFNTNTPPTPLMKRQGKRELTTEVFLLPATIPTPVTLERGVWLATNEHPPKPKLGKRERFALPAPAKIASSTLQLLWQTTHLICGGRTEFNAYCKKSGYLRTITGRDVTLPEELFESEGHRVIAQIRADALRIASPAERAELDVIGKTLLGNNSWACINKSVLELTNCRTELFTRLYTDEVLTWRNQLESQLDSHQRQRVANLLNAPA